MRTRIGLIALLGSLVLVGSVALTRSVGLTARFPGLDRVESAAEVAREGDRETVLLVAGKPVTAAELAEMEHWVAANLTWMREVGTSGAVTAEQRAFLERQAGLIERHGVPTVAVASLIVDRAGGAGGGRPGPPRQPCSGGAGRGAGRAWGSPMFPSAHAAASRTNGFSSLRAWVRSGTAGGPIFPSASAAARRTHLSLSWRALRSSGSRCSHIPLA